MKMTVKKLTVILLFAAALISLCSCDLIMYRGPKGTETAPQSSMTPETAPETTGSQTTKRTVRLITDVPTTAPESPYSLYLGILNEIQKESVSSSGQLSVKTFLFDGNGDGNQELFVVSNFGSRCICDVYYAENGMIDKAINGYEIFSGNAEEFYAGIAKKGDRYYLIAYSNTRYGREYTYRYCFIDLETTDTATVAEDFKKKDGSTEKSVHEYSVNGESVTESDFIAARDSYSVLYATEQVDIKGVSQIGMSVSELAETIKTTG